MDPVTSSSRAANEIAHGHKLADKGAENIWGWGSPAGKVRAARRGKIISEGAKLQPGMRVLEVGCGTGLFTEIFAASGANILAVDISGRLLELARQRNLPADRVRFLEKRFEDCDIDGPFDAIIGSSVLHHLEIDPALKRMAELLNPGGYLSFAEPNLVNPQLAVQKTVPWIKRLLGDSPDETAFVRWSFAKRLGRAGFVSIQIRPFDFLHPATPRFMIPLVDGVKNVVENIPLLCEISGSLHIRARRAG